MKIAIVYPDDFSIWHFHKELLKTLKNKGCDVYAISTRGNYVKYIEGLGVVHIPVGIDRFINPLKDFKLIFELFRIFSKHKFNIVHNFTIKPNIYGAIAARLAGTKKIIGTAEGLGSVYSDKPTLKIKIMRPLVDLLYKIGCRLSNKFWFVNPDDLNLFVDNKIISSEKTFLTVSAGVSLEEYSTSSEDKSNIEILRKELNLTGLDKIVVMIAARMIWSKGIREFIGASEILEKRYANIKFILVGPLEKDSPEAVPEEYLIEKSKSLNFEWLGFRNKIKEIYTMSDLVVLPSYYREGVPNVLLEAMAMGKAIVTTNNVGCKEVIEDGKNGYLVPIRDSGALANAIEILLNDDVKRKEFGKYSRYKVEKEFDKKIVIDKVMHELYEI